MNKRQWAKRILSDQVHEVATRVVVHQPYVMVEMSFWPDMQLAGCSTGFAKCRPGDEWNEQRGTAIAKGRALTELATMLAAKDSTPLACADYNPALTLVG